MTRTIVFKISLFAFLSFLSTELLAQATTVVKATVDRSSILIGEPIILKLEADIPETQPIRFFQLDSLPHFEFLATQKIDTSNTGSGTRLVQLIHITSFDSGHFAIPQLLLGDSILTDSIGIDVGYTPFDPQQPYHDIKDIIEVNAAEEKKKETWWWYVAGGALLLLILLVVYLKRKKKPVVQVVAVPIDPYEEAQKGLAQLKKTTPDAKTYYTQLSDIFRLYVSKRKDIHSLQHTTDDLVAQLKNIGLPKDLFDQLAQALRLSDFVKFAKYVPTAEDDASSFRAVERTIGEIEQAHKKITLTQPTVPK